MLALARMPFPRRLLAAGVACGLAALPRPADSAAAQRPVRAPAPGKLKLALLQISVGSDKAANLEHAERKIREAAACGAKLICLPECFNSPYGASFFPAYAEEIPETAASATEAAHPSTCMLLRVARQLGVYLVGGSIPEVDRATGKVYNCNVVVSPDGEIVCKHRKVHLFDIDVPGKITFRESDTLTAGDQLSLFDTPWGRVGVGICYDIRFPQYAHLLRLSGAHLLLYPGAFNMTTGPLHWELLARARAVDNQAFVAVPSPARDPNAGYQAWGHSSVIDPWGKVVATTEHEEAIVYAEIDLAEVDTPRQSIPVFDQKRDDLYTLKWTNARGGP